MLERFLEGHGLRQEGTGAAPSGHRGGFPAVLCTDWQALQPVDPRPSHLPMSTEGDQKLLLALTSLAQ